MGLHDKMMLIYLIGLVAWTAAFYLSMRESESAKAINIEIMSLVFGALWFLIVPFYLTKVILDRRSKREKK